MKQIINRVLISALLVSLVLLPARMTRAQAGITDDEIREILRHRIDVAKKSVGIVVGLVDDKGTRIISYGKANQTNDQAVNGDSVFEIGSVTKVSRQLCWWIWSRAAGLDWPIQSQNTFPSR